jgi:23S rRNA pseudouridine955/2504/2580 synthase
VREIELSEHEAGQRFDRYLRKLLPSVPLGVIFKLLRQGRIRVDGRKGKPELRLVAGMRVQLEVADAAIMAAPAPRAEPPAPRRAAAPRRQRGLEPQLVHQDDDLLVIDKPAGLAVQPGSGQTDDLVAWLQRQGRGVVTATFRPAPAHRLDRGTSGLLAIGLSPLGLRGLTAAFRDDEVEKVYVAVVHGMPPQDGRIEAPLRVREDVGAAAPRAVVDPAGKPARTDFTRLAVGPARALLRLHLHTGRLHQIRAHLAHLGHPIVGDRRYGSDVDLGDGRFLLQAGELALPHPRSGERLCWSLPVPAAFHAALAVRR